VIVIADTSPLNYLIQINCDSLLPQLYGKIAVPSGVLQELGHPGAPAAVRIWMTRLPGWIEVCLTSSIPNEGLAFLDLGEREAIQLAEERQADLLLIDERKGRLEANRRGLRTTGTLGVLLSAGELKLIDPVEAYRRLLTETTFRTSAALETQFLGQLSVFRL
jgi:predicted nucleic acid-binding protein